MKRTVIFVLIFVLGAALVCVATIAIVFLYAADQRAADARAQVSRWVEQLHGQTTETGVYVRHPGGNQLPENDPWGTPLNVTYAQGGFAETLTVRSAGPDRVFHTQDDIVAQRSVMNFKGIGNGRANYRHHGRGREVVQGLPRTRG